MLLSLPSPATVIYPADYNGNYCGKSGTVVEHQPYAYFPQLDRDIKAQLPVLMAGNWLKFAPYAICVAQCPAQFSLVDQTSYGGCNYTGADCGSGEDNAPSFYSSFETKKMLKRCFPVLEVAKGEERELCSIPDCTTAGKPCIAVPGEPDAGDGAPCGVTRQAPSGAPPTSHIRSGSGPWDALASGSGR